MDLNLLPRAATQTSDQALDDLHVFHPPEVNANAAGPANPFATVDDLMSMLYGASFSFAKGAAAHTIVTIQLLDRHGAPIAAPTMTMVWLSDSAAGVGVPAVAPTAMTFTTGAEIVDPATIKAAGVVQTDVDGTIVADVQSIAKTLYYVAVQVFGGDAPVISRKMVTGDYG